MKYQSTRGQSQVVTSETALVQGIAPDGGLYVPAEPLAPFVDGTSYRAILEGLLARFFEEIPEAVRTAAIEASLARFAVPTDPVPLHACGDHVSFLELFHGPTAAFKDVALTLLPHLLQSAAQQLGIAKVGVLTATSGDTGSAAMEGFSGVAGTKVIVFYPQVGTSEIQRRQMVCCKGENVSACAIEGNFDDAQAAVKAAFADPALQAQMATLGVKLSSANSINIGRLFPQIAYYLEAARRLGKPFNVVVPTGNFGNILAAYYAKRLGAPIQKFIVASNVNHVVCDFIRTGRYDARRDFHVTNSPSMDILVSSNVERLLWLLSEGDASAVRTWESALTSEGHFALTGRALATLQRDFAAGWATPEETEVAIREVWEQHHYLVDPHTAIGWKVAKELHLEGPCVIAATASPWKFPVTMVRALTGKTLTDEFKAAETLAQLTGETPLLTDLQTAPILHTHCVARAAVPAHIAHTFGA